jgi:carboxypeptidase C (cathepsin A)
MALLSLTLVPICLSAQTLDAARTATLPDELSRGSVSQDSAISTKHSLLLHGKTIPYTALAGNLLISDAKGAPYGSIFSVAYLEDGAPAKDRPVTFLFNGGPPAAAMWLHMASFGPVRLVANAAGSKSRVPFTYVSNEYSLLDDTDLVFIDAPLCGFSRAVGTGKSTDFEGTDEDVAAFEQFITRWLTANRRWASPKYLFGESYGGTRAAALVAAMNNDGVLFSGIVMESPVLNYNVRAPGYDTQAIGTLPTYAAIAYHFGKVSTQKSLGDWVEAARQFARGQYAAALAQGDTLSQAQFQATATEVAAYSGLRVDYLEQAKLRVDAARFRKELLRSEQRTLGRYDARVQGEDPDSVGETPSFDASETGVLGPVLGSLREYLASDLNYKNPGVYEPTSPEPATPWNWKHRTSTGVEQDLPDVAVDLADAMRKNPNLKVFIAAGYYDLSTPFASTEYDIHHMLLSPKLRANITFIVYRAGHMIYLDEVALKQMKRDLDTFYR